MASIIILRKDKEELKIDVKESAETIYLMVSGELENSSIYTPKKFINSILLTKENGKKIGINPRFITYYYDE